MFWVTTNYHDSTLAANNTAIVTDGFHGWSYFHCGPLSMSRIQPAKIPSKLNAFYQKRDKA